MTGSRMWKRLICSTPERWWLARSTASPIASIALGSVASSTTGRLWTTSELRQTLHRPRPRRRLLRSWPDVRAPFAERGKASPLTRWPRTVRPVRHGADILIALPGRDRRAASRDTAPLPSRTGSARGLAGGRCRPLTNCRIHRCDAVRRPTLEQPRPQHSAATSTLPSSSGTQSRGATSSMGRLIRVSTGCAPMGRGPS